MVLTAEKYREKIKKEIEELTRQIDSAPTGSIRINKNDNRYKWFVRSDDGSRKYIPKEQREYAQKLAVKSFNKRKLYELEKEEYIIEEFIEKMNGLNRYSDKDLFETEELGGLISCGLLEKNIAERDAVREWIEMDYERNNKYPEQLNVKVRNDLYVRSKSEAFIAMELIKAALPFRYECELILDDVAYYPDFTIMNPKTGEIILWEHFGMVDKPDYRRMMLAKLDAFLRNGYIPSVNMIITCETTEKPLDFENVRAQVALFFG